DADDQPGDPVQPGRRHDQLVPDLHDGLRDRPGRHARRPGQLDALPGHLSLQRRLPRLPDGLRLGAAVAALPYRADPDRPPVRGRYRGRLYGLAIGLDSNALEINGTLFDDAKVPRPPQSYTEKGWTMDAVLEAAKKLTKRQGDTPTQFGINVDMDAWQLSAFIWASGGQTLSDDLATLAWDQEPALKAIQFMADLVNVHKVAPAPSGGDAKTFGYATGKLAMQWSYPSQLTYRYNAKLAWDWTLAPEPQAGAPRTTVDYNLWTMNAKS